MTILGHRIFNVSFQREWRFSYETHEVNYRNWITTDFILCLGFIRVEGWLPKGSAE